MEDEKQVEQDRQRAEVFDALGHPTRSQILKVLSEGSLGFADLKKKTAIESSGHLQHHLTKLNGLIRTDEYGKYCLSDEGKDALLTVQTVENASLEKEVKEKRHRHFKVGLKPVAILLVALLVASSAVAVYEYIQASNLQKQVTNFNVAAYYTDAEVYFNEYGVIPTTNVNSSFAPPISMYHALQIGLDSQGWNKTSLKGTLVYAYLMDWEMYTNGTAPAGFTVGYAETIGSVGLTPPENYSKTYGNGVVYGYGWAIEVWNATQTPIPTLPLPFLGYSLVDATTGQILPTSAIFS